MKIPILTLYEPYAALMRVGAKVIETRGRPTKYRGPLGIHAAKTVPPAYMEAFRNPQIRRALEKAGYTEWDDFEAELGTIVCVVNVIDCRRIEASGVIPDNLMNTCWTYPPEEPELSFGNYTPGRFAWITDGLPCRFIEPITARGKQGIWYFEHPSLDKAVDAIAKVGPRGLSLPCGVQTAGGGSHPQPAQP